MGQARLRGSLEARIAQAIERDQVATVERKRIEAERQASMSPEQRKHVACQRLMSANLVGLMLALAATPTTHKDSKP